MLRPSSEVSGSDIALLVVPVVGRSTLVDRGYFPIHCPDSGINLPLYQSKFCDLAAGSDAVEQEKISQVYNATPAEICAWASQLASVDQ